MFFVQVASVAYRYRKWNLGNDIVLICRCELDAVQQVPVPHHTVPYHTKPYHTMPSRTIPNPWFCLNNTIEFRVADPHHCNANANPSFHLNPDPTFPVMRIQILLRDANQRPLT